MKHKRKIQIGDKFGKLVVIDNTLTKQYKSGKKGLSLVRCKCGKTWKVQNSNLTSGNTKSCGKYPCCDRVKNVRLPPGEQAKGFIYSNYKTNAINRNREFEISKDLFEEITSSNCYYCGSPPSNKTKDRYGSGAFVYNGIDRVDSNKGYLPNNVVPACITCNRAKNSLSLQEWQDWIARLLAHYQE